MSRFTVRALLGCCLFLAACAGLVRLTPGHAQARQHMQRGQWDSARVLLERELKQNPHNAEAWYDLGSVRKELRDLEGMIEAYRRAEPGLSEDRRRALPQIYYVTWAELYNTAVELYNRIVDSRDTSMLARAIEIIGKANVIRPEALENYDLEGRLYELRGDTTRALQSYERYISLLESEVQLAQRTGLALGILRDKAIDIFGPPVANRSNRTTTGDSMIVDRFTHKDDTVYVSSFARPQQGYRVEGWRVNPPQSWSADERFRYAPIALGPFYQAATISYNRRDFDRALQVLTQLSALSPSDETIQNFRIQIYRDQGRLEDALRELSESATRDPNNKQLLASLALVYFQMERYDDAIAEYEKVLQLDLTYDVALFNAAAALKNRAAQIQKEERERKDRDPKYKENEQRYFSLLLKAAEYFDRYRKLPEHRNDLTALEHIVNIYETVRNRDRLRQIITELEAMEQQYSGDVRYWELLGGYYARANQVEKAERAYKRADQLRRRN